MTPRCSDGKARVLEYSEYVQVLRSHDSLLADEIAGFHGMEAVLQWMQRRGLIETKIDIIGQDEFNYDFLIQLESEGRWLAFGVT
jgi:hypothetical protein